MPDHRTQTDKKRGFNFSQIEKFHPYKTFLFFVLLGSTVVFMTVTFLYLINFSKEAITDGFRLPKPFFISTLLLLISSFTISKVPQAFRRDSFRDLFFYLGTTLALGIFFIGCQAAGWWTLFHDGYVLNIQNHISFFYVLSGIHFLHVFAGTVFLSVILIQTWLYSKDEVKALLFFSNRFYLTRMELGMIFWHFVDFLWLGLFLIFLFTF